MIPHANGKVKCRLGNPNAGESILALAKGEMECITALRERGGCIIQPTLRGLNLVQAEGTQSPRTSGQRKKHGRSASVTTTRTRLADGFGIVSNRHGKSIIYDKRLRREDEEHFDFELVYTGEDVRFSIRL